MRRVALLFGLLLTALAPAGPAHADYIPPALTTLVRDATSVVDATVASVDAEGYVTLTVHGVWAGEAPAKITGIRYSCFGGPPRHFTSRVGQRLVFLFKGSEIFEETTLWPVRAAAGGGLQVKAPPLAEGFRAEARWVSMAAFKAELLALRPPERQGPPAPARATP